MWGCGAEILMSELEGSGQGEMPAHLAAILQVQVLMSIASAQSPPAHAPPCKQQQLPKRLSAEPLPTTARHLAFVKDKPSAFESTTPTAECVRGWLLWGVAFAAWGLPLGPAPSR